jgi:hypothetical protein
MKQTVNLRWNATSLFNHLLNCVSTSVLFCVLFGFATTLYAAKDISKVELIALEMQNAVNTSEFEEAFKDFKNWHQENEILSLLAYLDIQKANVIREHIGLYKSSIQDVEIELYEIDILLKALAISAVRFTHKRSEIELWIQSFSLCPMIEGENLYHIIREKGEWKRVQVLYSSIEKNAWQGLRAWNLLFVSKIHQVMLQDNFAAQLLEENDVQSISQHNSDFEEGQQTTLKKLNSSSPKRQYQRSKEQQFIPEDCIVKSPPEPSEQDLLKKNDPVPSPNIDIPPVKKFQQSDDSLLQTHSEDKTASGGAENIAQGMILKKSSMTKWNMIGRPYTQMNLQGDGTTGISFAYIPGEHRYIRMSIEYRYSIYQQLSVNPNAFQLSWGFGYDNWKPGTLSIRLNHWGPIPLFKFPDLKGAVVDLSYKLPMLNYKLFQIYSAVYVVSALNFGLPSFEFPVTLKFLEDFYFLMMPVFSPFRGPHFAFRYGFGYSNWQPMHFSLMFNNWELNTGDFPETFSLGALTASFNFEF